MLLFAALAWAAWKISAGQWYAGGALGAVSAVAIASIVGGKRLPPLFGMLLTTAAMLNASGYVMNLWHERTSFDEITHAFTAFAGMAALGWRLAKRRSPLVRGVGLTGSIIAAGIVLGLAWEAFELAIGIVGSLSDTRMDLLMDAFGAAAAAALVGWLAGQDFESR